MRKLISTVAALLFVTSGAAVAANPHSGTTGQPSQSCLSSTAPNEPGHAANARGSAFNENGGIAGAVYAGSGQTLNTPANSHAVSQYDVACFQVSQH
jgi:hypothetical protein